MTIGQRRRREREQRRRAILDSAKRLFLHEGFDKTSVEDIAASAELAKGTVYLYFDGKEDIYVSIVEELMEEVARQQLKMVAKASPEEALTRLGLSMIRDFSRNKMLCDLAHRNIAMVQKSLSPELKQRMQMLFHKQFEMFVEQFKRGKESGNFKIKDAEALARVFIAFLHGLLPMMRGGEAAQAAEQAASLGIRTFLAGCARPS